MRKKPKTNDKEQVFVKIDGSRSKRKIFLGSALDFAMMLKNYSEIKSIRHEKLKLMKSLKTECVSIRRIVNDIEKNDLPKAAVGEYTNKKFNVKDKNPKKIIEETHEDNEINKLKAELDDIDQKLKEL